MATRTYDPGAHFLMFAGIRISGFAEGTYIEVERAEDTFKGGVGAGGETYRVRSRNRMGTVKVTLLASSPTNDLLSAQQSLDENTGLGQGILSLVDANGTSNVAADSAWIMRPANMGMSKDMPTREWTFECAEMSMLVGGNL